MNTTDKNSREHFVLAYIACALWSSTDNSNESGGSPLDQNYDSDDIAPKTKVQMTADCEAFMDANAEALKDYPVTEAGHDFWLTRNHHGSGFWEYDHGTEEQCDKLTEDAHAYGEFDLYIGDDDLIWN